jgi:hypothetical protein
MLLLLKTLLQGLHTNPPAVDITFSSMNACTKKESTKIEKISRFFVLEAFCDILRRQAE